MTSKQTVVAGTFRYDTTEALFTGEVTVPGVDLEMRSGRTLPEIFSRALVDDEFDVAELGMTFHQRVLASGRDDFVALPIFPNRVFRHSCIFVSTASGIETPADLVGKTIGEFGIYSQDSGVWAKGVLMDEYGFDPAANRWIIGGLDAPIEPFRFVPQTRPTDLDIRDAGPGEALGTMLDAGEIDALFTANVPQAVLDGSPRIRRLFPNYEPLEREWFRRTGLFPMMHAVVVRRRLLESSPELVHAVYDGFVAAKERAAERYRQMRRLYEVQCMLPWAVALEERNRADLGDDWWPYGISDNHRSIEANLRYQHEQGLVDRRWRVDEFFAAEFLDT
jgi:hypothetical protein